MILSVILVNNLINLSRYFVFHSLSVHRITTSTGLLCLPTNTGEVSEVVKEADDSDHPHTNHGPKRLRYRPRSRY